MKTLITLLTIILVGFFLYDQCIQLEKDISQFQNSIGESSIQGGTVSIPEASYSAVSISTYDIFLRLVGMLIIPGLLIFFLLGFHFAIPSLKLTKSHQFLKLPQKIRDDCCSVSDH